MKRNRRRVNLGTSRERAERDATHFLPSRCRGPATLRAGRTRRGIRTGAPCRRGSRGPMLGLTQLSNYLTLKGSFSALSKPNVASKYALESSRRDLHNALLCTVLNAQNFRQKSLKICYFFRQISLNLRNLLSTQLADHFDRLC